MKGIELRLKDAGMIKLPESGAVRARVMRILRPHRKWGRTDSVVRSIERVSRHLDLDSDERGIRILAPMIGIRRKKDEDAEKDIVRKRRLHSVP